MHNNGFPNFAGRKPMAETSACTREGSGDQL